MTILDHYERGQPAFDEWRKAIPTIAVGADMCVSDHALLRYLERAIGLEIEAYREILASQVRPAVEAGASRVKVEGMEFVIRNGLVVTCFPSNGKLPKDRRR